MATLPRNLLFGFLAEAVPAYLYVHWLNRLLSGSLIPQPPFKFCDINISFSPSLSLPLRSLPHSDCITLAITRNLFLRLRCYTLNSKLLCPYYSTYSHPNTPDQSHPTSHISNIITLQLQLVFCHTYKTLIKDTSAIHVEENMKLTRTTVRILTLLVSLGCTRSSWTSSKR